MSWLICNFWRGTQWFGRPSWSHRRQQLLRQLLTFSFSAITWLVIFFLLRSCEQCNLWKDGITTIKICLVHNAVLMSKDVQSIKIAPSLLLSFLAPVQVPVVDVSSRSSAPVLSPVRTPVAPSIAQAPAAAVAMSPAQAPPAEAKVAPVAAAPAEALGIDVSEGSDLVAGPNLPSISKDWIANKFSRKQWFFRHQIEAFSNYSRCFMIFMVSSIFSMFNSGVSCQFSTQFWASSRPIPFWAMNTYGNW